MYYVYIYIDKEMYKGDLFSIWDKWFIFTHLNALLNSYMNVCMNT